MSTVRAFKQGLAAVSRHWEGEDYDAALAKVEDMRKTWPGNSHLLILWANLVQLQEHPKSGLEEAKQALVQAIELDKSSPAGHLELGQFLDNVDDNPQAAVKAYAEAVAQARQLLIEGLIGQARALLQLDKKDAAFRCLGEILAVQRYEGPLTEQLEELLGQVMANRSA